DGHDRDRVGTELAAELRLMADWLGLSEVDVANNGNLAAAVRKRV
ncbi:MAG: winged helix-turn-helix domain-containing protein, partial [Acidimicrobiia bacterium]|nr:winged helix-turn-helix domain-containing protein [Acidimicrobiia bacterium]